MKILKNACQISTMAVRSSFMFDSLTSGEFIVGFFFGGMILRFGFKCADFVLDGYKQMIHDLKVHFQKPSK